MADPREPPLPRGFCVECRALTGEGEPCDCASSVSIVPLDSGAAGAIEAALLHRPKVDAGDLVTRLAVSILIGPGSVAVLFVFAGVALSAVVPAMGAVWPWVFGVPLAFLTVGWSAFLIASTLEQARPYYTSAPRPALAGEPVVKGIVDGEVAIGALEVRPHGVDAVVVRDAWSERPLVLRRPGQRIEVPAGRLCLVLPKTRWRRAARSAIGGRWDALPEAMFAAGALLKGEVRRGDELELWGGTLEPIGMREASFREAADEQLRWVPDGGRTRARVAGG